MRVRLRANSADLAQRLRPLTLRSRVVLKLLFARIERKRPVFEGRGDAASLCQRAQTSVEASYPDTASERPEEERTGVTPRAVLKEIQRCSCRGRQHGEQSYSLIFEHNATPADRVSQASVVLENARPLGHGIKTL